MESGIPDEKDMGVPTVVSLFAGCGGSSLGYERAGFRELLAVDFEKHCEETFAANFTGVKFILADVTKLEAKDVMREAGVSKGELDVLDGSPPCQGFSMAGKRKVQDSRNDLFRHFIRMIEGLRPRIFLMENVAGQSTGRMKGRFKEIMLALKETGYEVRCKRMNSKWYGVAQSRERLIYIGTRPGMPPPSYPEPDKTIVTVRKALKDCPFGGEVMFPSDTGKTKWGMTVMEIAKRIPQGKDGKFIVGKGQGFGLTRASWNRCSKTVVKMVSKGMTAGMLHPEENRYMTIEELKRLCSFPDDFKLEGKFEDKWARLGNAVMPRFMEAIASHMRKEILEHA